ncbi:AAA family ATPase [Ralstonia nicotianae]|uniref:AAA family ATPase n=1 Tax=Ralstonia pseudosolanacearum TaxID=1310165 RepID=UPI001F2B1A09|nr:ATP-binding protein [Ralstonia solanacearum]
MAGLAQSERSLVGSLIANRHLLKERRDQLEHVFAHLGLKAQVDVDLVPAGSKKGAVEDFGPAKQQIHDIELEAASGSTQEAHELMQAMREFQSPQGNKKIRFALDQIRGRRGSSLRISAEATRPQRGLTVAMWELLLRLGLVTIGGTTFTRSGRSMESISGDQLSSGQWGWLGTFGALVAELRHGCLILVDEPENSLHPSWQRAFMKELHRATVPFEDCQVVVATHSPLVASGVAAEWGNVRTLVRANRVDAIVRSCEVPSVYGWNSSDVYDELFGLDSTRALEFLEVANAVLRHFAEDRPVSRHEAANWITDLEARKELLPPFDPMRGVFSDIVAKIRRASPGIGK